MSGYKRRADPGTTITARRRMAMAAVLGVTNAGQRMPTRHDVERMLTLTRHLDVESCAFSLVQSICEDQQTLEMFQQEARHWHDVVLADYTEEHVTRVWPDVAALLVGIQ